MQTFRYAALALFLTGIILLSGCGGSGGEGAPPKSRNASIETMNVTYSAGAARIPAILCRPLNSSEATPAVVLTGGDGATEETLRPVCEAFARRGLIALAHGNVNGSIESNVAAVAAGVDYLTNSSPSRPVSLWAHSAGTIFSLFAAYERPGIRAFVETSGHMQVPLCDSRASAKPGDQCAAYLDEFPAPILVVHGSDDSTVPLSYGQAFAARLKGLGKPHDTLYVSGAKHEFMTDREYVLDREAAFITANSGSAK